jgi:ABC-2 type transport system permease protein
VVCGGVADGVKQLVDDDPDLAKIFERMGGQTGIVDAYLASIMSIMALIASAYAIQATLRLRAEETGQRAEPVLATGTGRLSWAASHLVLSALGSTSGCWTSRPSHTSPRSPAVGWA